MKNLLNMTDVVYRHPDPRLSPRYAIEARAIGEITEAISKSIHTLSSCHRLTRGVPGKLRMRPTIASPFDDHFTDYAHVHPWDNDDGTPYLPITIVRDEILDWVLEGVGNYIWLLTFIAELNEMYKEFYGTDEDHDMVARYITFSAWLPVGSAEWKAHCFTQTAEYRNGYTEESRVMKSLLYPMSDGVLPFNNTIPRFIK